MSHRGYSKVRNGGRGGRSQGAFKKKKSIEDYVYYVGSARQASDYEITTEFVINHIRKTYTDGENIATALETLEATKKLNYVPAKHGVSRYYSPRMIVHKTGLD